MWLGLPYIARRDEPLHRPINLVNGPGLRPYIESKNELRWTWREWECPVAEIKFTEPEIAFARSFCDLVVIEPHIKQKASPNKDWGRERWCSLIGLLRSNGLEPVQLGPLGTQVLPGARLIMTPGFRYACAVLAKAKVAILPEGGLHHAAAALGVPSIVIFGGYIGPKQTGYTSQVNLFTGGEACGMRIPCKHCEKAMAQIEPAAVLAETMRLISGEDRSV
jgi:ADP-heptose:LPS heptosyltransferase